MSGRVWLDGAKIAEARASKGMSQLRLAEITNLSSTTIEKAESGGALRASSSDRILTMLGLELVDVRVMPPSPANLLLPPRPESFIGRDDLCKKVTTSLTEEQRRVVLHGLPGIGKTTVASEMAYRLIPKFADGVFWVSLGSRISEQQILHKLLDWARQCEIRDASLISSVDVASSALRAAFVNRHVLLVIDDIWQIADALPFCAAGDKCGILATTRSLSIAENLWPKPADRRRLDGLAEDDALDLLRENASQIVDDNIEQCRKLASQLDGLPAALHVAGKWLASQEARGRDIELLVADLSADIRPLLERILPTRHGYVAEDASSTVFALIDKSFQKLDVSTKRCYVRLCGFPPSPIRIPTSRFVDAFEIDAEACQRAIESLVDAGLIEPAGHEAGEECFTVHALITAHSDAVDWESLK